MRPKHKRIFRSDLQSLGSAVSGNLGCTFGKTFQPFNARRSCILSTINEMLLWIVCAWAGRLHRKCQVETILNRGFILVNSVQGYKCLLSPPGVLLKCFEKNPPYTKLTGLFGSSRAIDIFVDNYFGRVERLSLHLIFVRLPTCWKLRWRIALFPLMYKRRSWLYWPLPRAAKAQNHRRRVLGNLSENSPHQMMFSLFWTTSRRNCSTVILNANKIFWLSQWLQIRCFFEKWIALLKDAFRAVPCQCDPMATLRWG